MSDSSDMRQKHQAPLAMRFFRYAGVGVVGTAAQYCTLVALVASGLTGPVGGSVSGAVAGAVVNYELNRRYTFSTRAPIILTLPKFAATACFGMLINGLVMKWLAVDLGINYLIAQVVATGVVLVATFSINSVWTFRQKGQSGRA
ncbi:GtrA family protein [Paraburkholderia diazotrophica]|nr:GtrA family protein [Paraburkholderia diazotrophica]